MHAACASHVHNLYQAPVRAYRRTVLRAMAVGGVRMLPIQHADVDA